jgi:hypothetical protein
VQLVLPGEGGHTNAQQQFSGQQQNVQAGGDIRDTDVTQSPVQAGRDIRDSPIGGQPEAETSRPAYVTAIAVIAFLVVVTMVVLGIAGSVPWKVVVPVSAAIGAVAALVVRRS